MSSSCRAFHNRIRHDVAHGRKWFAVYTATRHEKSVVSKLAERQIESFVPLYRTERRWKKRGTVELNVPLFPNYVFVRVARTEQIEVLGTPGVYAIVGDGHCAWEIPESDMATLLLSIDRYKAEPHPYLVVGERARIKSGVLSGIEGVIIRNKANTRIVLTLEQIKQSLSIEVGAEELERVVPGPK